MVPPCECTGLQTVNVSDVDDLTSLIRIPFISYVEENVLLGWGIKVGILNTTRQNFRVVECCDEELDIYKFPCW